jgi:hypothetical protein
VMKKAGLSTSATSNTTSSGSSSTSGK